MTPDFYSQVLCSTWKDDGTTVFTGGCDKQVKMWPLLSGGAPTTVAMHDAPVKEIAWISQMNLLVSGSWDKTLRSLFELNTSKFILLETIASITVLYNSLLSF